jgi:hypothetical protein
VLIYKQIIVDLKTKYPHPFSVFLRSKNVDIVDN